MQLVQGFEPVICLAVKSMSSATTLRCLAISARPSSQDQCEDLKRSWLHTHCKGLGNVHMEDHGCVVWGSG